MTDTDAIQVGSIPANAQYLLANVAAGGTDTPLVAAVAGKRIRVLAAIMVCGSTATTFTFNSKPGGAGSAISPTFPNGSNGGAVLPFCPAGWFQTNVGEGLSATTGAGSTTAVQLVYIQF